MIHLTSKNFDIEAKNCRGAVVVMFYADWCGKCAMMKPVAESVSRKYYDRIKFCEVNVDECPELAKEYGADIVPTFVMFRDREVEMYMQGMLDGHIFEERVKELLQAALLFALKQTRIKESLKVFKKSFMYKQKSMCYIVEGKS